MDVIQMKMRPVDDREDILPVLHNSDMTTEANAVAVLVLDRLNLLAGEWWENREWGNQILAMLQESRLTEADATSLSVYLTDYVRATKGVQEVLDVTFSISGMNYSWSCTVITEYGNITVDYEI